VESRCGLRSADDAVNVAGSNNFHHPAAEICTHRPSNMAAVLMGVRHSMGFRVGQIRVLGGWESA
jgi:hypothetical protein